MKFGDIPGDIEVTQGLVVQAVSLPDKVTGLPDVLVAVQTLIRNQNAVIAALSGAGLLAVQEEIPASQGR